MSKKTASLVPTPAHRSSEADHRLALHQMRETPIGTNTVHEGGKNIVAVEYDENRVGKTRQPDADYQLLEQAGLDPCHPGKVMLS